MQLRGRPSRSFSIKKSPVPRGILPNHHLASGDQHIKDPGKVTPTNPTAELRHPQPGQSRWVSRVEVAEHVHHLPRHRRLAAASSWFLPAVGSTTKPHWNRSAGSGAFREPRFLPTGFRLKFDPDPAAPSANPSDRKGSRTSIPEPGYITRNGPKAGSGSVPSNVPPLLFQDGGVMYIWNSNGFAAGGRTLFSCMLVPGICGMPPSGERPLRHSPLRSDIPFFPIGAVL